MVKSKKEEIIELVNSGKTKSDILELGYAKSYVTKVLNAYLKERVLKDTEVVEENKEKEEQMDTEHQCCGECPSCSKCTNCLEEISELYKNEQLEQCKEFEETKLEDVEDLTKKCEKVELENVKKLLRSIGEVIDLMNKEKAILDNINLSLTQYVVNKEIDK
ncbi:hypothetical protein SAMN02745196_02278 [Clostridium collagenovorans DSM 3089]|uniref:Uncharacterized protein n=1 Tax=Clostridium collagenovorans DSM 3089 TaxID=1121306 RepID=A0A1M5XIW0_9CLOT|nr:hypothetical protein [Clostridium collagenovorans]SHH99562.1 hypothetical protein SAMN02745196_02278 [Clostridium collagenovorans DSM 3089]